jgi:hypothetical protein
MNSNLTSSEASKFLLSRNCKTLYVIYRSFEINLGEIGNSWKLLGRSGTYGRCRKSRGDPWKIQEIYGRYRRIWNLQVDR